MVENRDMQELPVYSLAIRLLIVVPESNSNISNCTLLSQIFVSSSKSQMDIFGMFSDDQTAILGCFAALAVCGMIAALSFHLGPAGRQQKQIDASRNRTLPLEKPESQPQRQDRRAA